MNRKEVYERPEVPGIYPKTRVKLVDLKNNENFVILSIFSNDELIDELVNRNAVREIVTEDFVKWVVEDETGIYESGDGKARILVVKNE